MATARVSTLRLSGVGFSGVRPGVWRVWPVALSSRVGRASSSRKRWGFR